MNKLIIVFLILSGLLLTACGTTLNIKTEVTHKIDIDNIIKYFEGWCETEEPSNMEECVNRHVQEYLDFLQGIEGG